MTTDPGIRRGSPEDLATATALLAAEGLPVDDLTAAHMRSFLLATGPDGLAGMVGLETFDATGLLRSLVVKPSSRGRGLGERLVLALEAAARREGIGELWLLTIDADRFFRRHGYAVAERAAAPKPIRTTAEFSALCPGDAVLMRKRLR